MATTYEPLQLTFYAEKEKGSYTDFYCKHTGGTNEYMFIAHLLDMLCPLECEYIIETIENAQNGLPFDPYHGPDSMSSDDQFDIVPPNVVYGGGIWSLPMEDWKQIMQAWRDFMILYS